MKSSFSTSKPLLISLKVYLHSAVQKGFVVMEDSNMIVSSWLLTRNKFSLSVFSLIITSLPNKKLTYSQIFAPKKMKTIIKTIADKIIRTFFSFQNLFNLFLISDIHINRLFNTISTQACCLK